MNEQQLMDEIHERFGEHLEHDQDNCVLIQILIKMILNERSVSEAHKMKLKRMELIWK